MRVKLHTRFVRRAAVIAAVAVLAMAFLVTPALAAPENPAGQRPAGIDVSGNGDEIVRAGGDAVVWPGQTVDSVTVFGGDAIVAGTVRHTVVAIGGDVVLRSTARVGTQMSADDATVFSIGGTTRTAPGAVVTGTTGAWEDVSSGEALVAAAVAMTGIAVAGSILVALAVGVVAIMTLLGAAALAALIWLIVWLARRDDRKRGTPAYGPTWTAYPDAVPAPTEAGTFDQSAGSTDAVQPHGAPASAAPPATA